MNIELKAITYAFVASVAGSFGVLLLGACVFGFEVSQWPEWANRVVSAVGTVAAIGGAAAGVLTAWRAKHAI